MSYLPVKTDPLPGTVTFYQRHVVVCAGPADWPERIELDQGFLQDFAQAITARASDMSLKVKMTACDESPRAGGYDILVFPDNIRYLGVGQADLPLLVETHLVNNRVAATLPHEPITHTLVLVCRHRQRDIRCGECGPTLVEAFGPALQAHGLADKVLVRGSSHIGGHKYAGNVIIYPNGDWYGYVAPADVPRLVEQHLVRGQLMTDLWRGRMGLSPEEQVKVVS